ncbi:MAG: PLP-dependent transferase [Coriobacteriales bacterium]|jgi:O-acetylhomoserine (thiol)-lyase|nr:PLP-dependent transferase [Coriobacteriales bacterium]
MIEGFPFKDVDTTAVQGGYQPASGEPRQVPIIQSTTFKYSTSEQMARLFDLAESGYFYSRLANPTNDKVAAKICDLEGGSAAMLTASGQAANFFAMFNIASAGDHIVASSAIYGGTFNLISVTMARMGVECTFVEPDCSAEELEAAFRPNTKLVFGESVSNPSLAVLDFDKFSAAAKAHGVPLIVDNTFPTPINCNPLGRGANIVTHSTTKYMDGHGSCVGGAIVDGGNFDWTAYGDRYACLTTPDESYHGVVYTDAFGLGGAYITKATAQLMRDLGSIPSPISSFIMGAHLESLHLRIARHVANAQRVAEYLQANPKVAWVRYPGLPGDPYYELAQKYMPKGTCGVIAFGLNGSAAEAAAFTDKLKMIAIATHVADARSCILHPASTTHRQLNNEQLAAAGVKPELLRLSCGIEGADDIVADLDQAFAQI